MKTPGMNFYQKREYLSISALTTFARCPRRFFYSSGCRLGDVGGPHHALTYGEAMHKALGVLIRNWDMTAAVEAFKTIWTPEKDGLADPMRNSGRATLTLAMYHATHAGGKSLFEMVDPPKNQLVINDRVSDYEVAFAIDIGLPIPLVGRIDGLARHRHTSELWALEFKTTSELSTRFLNAFHRSPQICAYTLAARTYFPSHRVVGGIVEGLLSAKSSTNVQAVPIMVQDFQLETFLEWARRKGSELLYCEENGHFPQDYTGCNSYSMFGQPGYECDYGRLCNIPDWTGLKDTYVVKDDRPFTLVATPAAVTVKGVVV